MVQMKANTEFDKKDYFETEIQPLLNELVNKCKGASLPCFATVCVQNTADGSKYKSAGNLPGSNRMSLTEDRFKDYLMVGLGFSCRTSKQGQDVIAADDDYEEVG